MQNDRKTVRTNAENYVELRFGISCFDHIVTRWNARRLSTERCPVHPLKKRLIVHDQIGIDYRLTLCCCWLISGKGWPAGYSGLKGATVVALLRPYYKKILKSHQKRYNDRGLSEWTFDSRTGTVSIAWPAAEPFAKLMEEVFAAEWLSDSPNITAVCVRWDTIWKVDHLDRRFDVTWRKHVQTRTTTHSCQFGEPQTEAEEDAWRDQIAVWQSEIFSSIGCIADAWDRDSDRKNKGLIENIIYLGLLRKTEQVLRKGTIENAEPIWRPGTPWRRNQRTNKGSV